jgi:hypothetical protein
MPIPAGDIHVCGSTPREALPGDINRADLVVSHFVDNRILEAIVVDYFCRALCGPTFI